MSEGRSSRPGGRRAGPLLGGAVLAATLLPAMLASPGRAGGEAIDLLLTVDRQAVALSDDLRRALVEHADRVVRSCSYDAGDREDRVWRAALAEASFLRLSYAVPVRLKLARREIPISEAVFSLGDPEFLGSPVLHHAGRTTLVFKCSGTAMLKLMCMPGLAPHVPPNYRKVCRHLDLK